MHRTATTFYYTCTGLLGFTNLKGQACINTFAELSCDCRGTAPNEEKKGSKLVWIINLTIISWAEF